MSIRNETAFQRDELEAEIELGITKITDTFPDDFRADAVRSRINEFREKGTITHLQLASLYVQWACSHPGWISSDPPDGTCSCPEGSGWVFLEDDPNVVRPCLRCNRSTYDIMFGEPTG